MREVSWPPNHLESATAARCSDFAAASGLTNRSHVTAAVTAAVVMAEQSVQQSAFFAVAASRSFATASWSGFETAGRFVNRSDFAATSGLTSRSGIATATAVVEQPMKQAGLPSGSTARIDGFAAAGGSHFVAARRGHFAATSRLTNRGGVTSSAEVMAEQAKSTCVGRACGQHRYGQQDRGDCTSHFHISKEGREVSSAFEPRYVGAAVSGRARRFSGLAVKTVDLRIAA